MTNEKLFTLTEELLERIEVAKEQAKDLKILNVWVFPKPNSPPPKNKINVGKIILSIDFNDKVC